jgi:hypothetical protein
MAKQVSQLLAEQLYFESIKKAFREKLRTFEENCKRRREVQKSYWNEQLFEKKKTKIGGKEVRFLGTICSRQRKRWVSVLDRSGQDGLVEVVEVGVLASLPGGHPVERVVDEHLLVVKKFKTRKRRRNSRKSVSTFFYKFSRVCTVDVIHGWKHRL